VPDEVLTMYRRQRRREGIVVNSFAYLGLALGVALFLVLFVAYDALWWRILDILILVAASRLFAALLGGLLGDEVGYRFARRRLAREWREWVTRRA
jgi:Flp pilus assembly protein TadB